MTIGKTIPKPRNWQDFEKLCKKLFGEIWRCPNTIKANGRSGQTQNGVDIYGIPEGCSRYWGIQCKGKDDYTDSSLTEKEVDAEIEKAATFQPLLETFSIATTANKDSKIEEHVRKRDVESRAAGRFAIQLYCWEDLADLIEENRSTFNWWVKEKRHKELFNFDIHLLDGKLETTLHPKFRRVQIKNIPPRLTNEERVIANFNGFLTPSFLQGIQQAFASSRPQRKNLSWCEVPIFIENSGQEVIENYRIDFSLEGEFQEISDDRDPLSNLTTTTHQYRSFFVWDEHGEFMYEPYDQSPLTQVTQGDSRSMNLHIKPNPEKYDIKTHWKLYARDFTKEGELMLHVDPEFEETYRTQSTQGIMHSQTEILFEDMFEQSDE